MTLSKNSDQVKFPIYAERIGTTNTYKLWGWTDNGDWSFVVVELSDEIYNRIIRRCSACGA